MRPLIAAVADFFGDGQRLLIAVDGAVHLSQGIVSIAQIGQVIVTQPLVSNSALQALVQLHCETEMSP